MEKVYLLAACVLGVMLVGQALFSIAFYSAFFNGGQWTIYINNFNEAKIEFFILLLVNLLSIIFFPFCMIALKEKYQLKDVKAN